MQDPVYLRRALEDAKEDLMRFVESRGNDAVAANLYESLNILATAIQDERKLTGLVAPVTAELQEAYLVLTVSRLVQQKPSDASAVFEQIKHTCTKTLRLINSSSACASTIMQMLWTGGAGKMESLFHLTYTLSEYAVKQPQKSCKRRRLLSNESTRPVEAWKVCYCYFICALAMETLCGDGIPATRDDWSNQVHSLVERPLRFSTAMSTAKALFLLDQCTEEKPRLPRDFEQNLGEPVKELIELNVLSQATGLDNYIVAAAIMERLLKKDDPDRKLSSLFCLLLQESGRFEFMEKVKSMSDTQNRKRRLDDDGSTNVRLSTPHARFCQPGYPIRVEIRVLLYLGRTSEAITLADDMSKLLAVAEDDKRQAYSNLFDFLLSESLLLFTPPERRHERLDILFVPHAGKLAMETFLGRLEALSRLVENKEGASTEVKTYLKKACHQAQIRLLRSKYVVSDKIPEEFRYEFPSLGQLQLDQWLVDYPNQQNLVPVPISKSDIELWDLVGLEAPPAEPDSVVDDDADETPPERELIAPNFSLGPYGAHHQLPLCASEVLDLDLDDKREEEVDSPTKMHGMGPLGNREVLWDSSGAQFHNDAEAAEAESEKDDSGMQFGEASVHDSSDEYFQNAAYGDETVSEGYGYAEERADDSGEPSDESSGQGGSTVDEVIDVGDDSASCNESSVEQASSDDVDDDDHGEGDPYDRGFPAGSMDALDDRQASMFRTGEHLIVEHEDDRGYDAEVSQDNLSEEEDNPVHHGSNREMIVSATSGFESQSEPPMMQASSLPEEEGYDAEMSQNTATKEEDNIPLLDYARTSLSKSDANDVRQLLDDDEDGYVPEGEISQEEDNKNSPAKNGALKGADAVDIGEEENKGYEGEVSQDNATEDEDIRQSQSARSSSRSNAGQEESLIPPPPIRAVEKEGDPGYDADADGKPIRRAVKLSVEHETSQETGYSAGESEELSEAIHTEDEEEKRQATASQQEGISVPSERQTDTVQPMSLSSRADMQQRSMTYTYSDMSAADERTTGGHEEDLGAESSSDVDLPVDFSRSEIEPYYPQNGAGFRGDSLHDVARIVQGSSGSNTMHAPERRVASLAASIPSRSVAEAEPATSAQDSSATAPETVSESARHKNPSAETVEPLGRMGDVPEESAIVDHVPHDGENLMQNEEHVDDTTASIAGSQEDMSIATLTRANEVTDYLKPADSARAEENPEQIAALDRAQHDVDENLLHAEEHVGNTTASTALLERDTGIATEIAAAESVRAENQTVESAVVDHVPQDGDEDFPRGEEHVSDTTASVAGSQRDTSIATETAAYEGVDDMLQAEADTSICADMKWHTEEDVNETFQCDYLAPLQRPIAEANIENEDQTAPDSGVRAEEMVESRGEEVLTVTSQAARQSAETIGDEKMNQKPSGLRTRAAAKAQYGDDSNAKIRVSEVAEASTASTMGDTVLKRSTHAAAGSSRPRTRSRARHADSDSDAGASVASSTRSGSCRMTPQKKSDAVDSSKDTVRSSTRTPRTGRKPIDAEDSVASSVARRRRGAASKDSGGANPSGDENSVASSVARRVARKPAKQDHSDAEDSATVSSESSLRRHRLGATAKTDDVEPESTPRRTPAKAPRETPPPRQSARLRERQLAKRTEKDADEASVTSSVTGVVGVSRRRGVGGSVVRPNTDDSEKEELPNKPVAKKPKTSAKPPLAPPPSGRRSVRKK